MSTTQIKLDFPITVAGAAVGVVSMRRMSVRDLIAYDSSKEASLAKEAVLIANLCDLLPESIYAMDAADYKKCQTVVQGFLG